MTCPESYNPCVSVVYLCVDFSCLAFFSGNSSLSLLSSGRTDSSSFSSPASPPSLTRTVHLRLRESQESCILRTMRLRDRILGTVCLRLAREKSYPQKSRREVIPVTSFMQQDRGKQAPVVLRHSMQSLLRKL